jgi:hypothetical protein
VGQRRCRREASSGAAAFNDPLMAQTSVMAITPQLE